MEDLEKVTCLKKAIKEGIDSGRCNGFDAEENLRILKNKYLIFK